MEYIVSWCIIIWVSVTVNVTDEFGRYSHSYYETRTEEDCNHSKTFADRDSAFIFYDKVQTEANYNKTFSLGNGRLTEVKIDSVLITPNEQ